MLFLLKLIFFPLTRGLRALCWLDYTCYSPCVRESKTDLDSGFHAVHSRFQVLDFSLCFWNLDSNRYLYSGFLKLYPGFLELYSGFQNQGDADSTNKNFPHSGIRITLYMGRCYMKSTLCQFLYTACHQRDAANGRRKITVEKFTLIEIGNEQIKTAHRNG